MNSVLQLSNKRDQNKKRTLSLKKTYSRSEGTIRKMQIETTMSCYHPHVKITVNTQLEDNRIGEYLEKLGVLYRGYKML